MNRTANTQIAAIQMRSGPEVSTNLKTAAELLREAGDAGARLAVLPENFACMGSGDEERGRVAETDGSGPIQEWCSRIAQDLGLWLVAGTLPIKSATPERPFSASLVFDDQGGRRGRYDKIHLFDVNLDSGESYRESAFTTAGDDSLVIDTPAGRLGVAICYDLRFPELFRKMAESGLDLVAVPAAFTMPTGRAHWKSLVTMRALENLCYVAASAQTGSRQGRKTWGHSMIAGPWGEVLADAGSKPGVVSAGVSRNRLVELRREFPALEHRRL